MKRLFVAVIALTALSSGLYAASNTLSGLILGGAVTGTDLFYDVQTTGVGGVKVTGAQIKTFMSSSPTFSGTVTLPDTTTWTTTGFNGSSGSITAGIGSFTTLTAVSTIPTVGSTIFTAGGGSLAILTAGVGSFNTLTSTGLTATNGSFGTLTFTGQLISAGGTPSVSACGTSPTGAVSATSTNQSGSLSTGGNATLTSCGIKFSVALTPSVPRTCTIVAQSSAAASDMTQTLVSALTAGGWTLTAVNTLNSATFGYICL